MEKLANCLQKSTGPNKSHEIGENISPMMDDTAGEVWTAAAAEIRAQQMDCWRQEWCHKDISIKQRWISPNSVLPLKISTSQKSGSTGSKVGKKRWARQSAAAATVDGG